MEAILWKFRTGAPWRAIYLKNFARGQPPLTASVGGPRKASGRIFLIYEAEIDEEWIFVDRSYVRAHQHTSEARIVEERAIGKSRDRLTTKIDVVADAHGKLIDFEVAAGEVYDVKAANKLFAKVGDSAENFIAEIGYDSEEIGVQARSKNMTPIIPRKSSSVKPNPKFDSHLNKQFHFVENLFARLKHFRSIATRFKKLARDFKWGSRTVLKSDGNNAVDAAHCVFFKTFA